MRLKHAFSTLLLVALAMSPAARATSMFTLSGDLTNGGTFNGTLSLDATGDAYVQGTYRNGSDSFTLPTNYLGEQLGEGTYTTVDVFSVNQSYDLFLIFPDASLAGYAGGNLCALRSSCFPLTTSYSDFTTGAFPNSNFIDLSATPATTPEPESLALFGSGSLALVTLLRRRRHAGPPSAAGNG